MIKLQNAFDLIDAGISVRQAANQEGLNFSFVQRKNVLRVNGTLPKITHRTLLTKQQEQKLEDHVINCALRGFPKTIRDIQRDAMHILKAFPSSHIYKLKDGVPGRRWARGFMKRHPKLSSRKCEAISKANSKVCTENLRSWHKYIYDYLKSIRLEHLLNDPSIIANSDESGMPLTEKDSKRIGLKSLKTRYNIQLGNSKENMSVLFTGLADGTLLKPFVVFKGERLSPQMVSKLPHGIDFVITKSGWMEHDAFMEFVVQSFVPQMKQLKRKPPYLLFIDGHRSHISLEISSACEDNGVILITLYPNATHIIQPLDVSLFRPFKIKWQEAIHKRKIDDPYFSLTKFNFPSIFVQFLEANDFSMSIRNGFKKCGLYPYCFNSIDLNRIVALPSSVQPESQTTSYVFGPDPTFYDIVAQTTKGVDCNHERDDAILGSSLSNSSPVNGLAIESRPVPIVTSSLETHIESNALEEYTDNAVSYDWGSHNNNVESIQEGYAQWLPVVSDERTEAPINDVLMNLSTEIRSPIHVQFDDLTQYPIDDPHTNLSTEIRRPIHFQYDDVTQHPQFEEAAKTYAKKYAFDTVQKIVGPNLDKLLSNHQFQEFSAVGYALKTIYLTFKPPETCEDILLSPPPVFGTVNVSPNMDRVVVSSQKARDTLQAPTPAQKKKVEQMQERMKQRELKRQAKIQRDQEEKMKKAEEKKRMKEEKENEIKNSKKRKITTNVTKNKKLKVLQDIGVDQNSLQ